VVDQGDGILELRNGHIATDPRVIPTNTEVILLLTINGEEEVLRVKATDIGGAIKGRHVDLPMHLSSREAPLPNTKFPLAVVNPNVQVLMPVSGSI